MSANQRKAPWPLYLNRIDRHPNASFPSLREHGGINLVIFTELLAPPDWIEPNDPNHRLPANQSSWARSS